MFIYSLLSSKCHFYLVSEVFVNKKISKSYSYLKKRFSIFSYYNKFFIILDGNISIGLIKNFMYEFFFLRGVDLSSTFLTKDALIFEGNKFNFIKNRFSLAFCFNFIRNYKRKLKLIIKNNFGFPVSKLILSLNSLILKSFNVLIEKKMMKNTLLQLDIYLYRLLWKWAKRRHSRRSNTWIYTKYWKFVSGVWRFFALDELKGGFIFLRSHYSESVVPYSIPVSLDLFDLLNHKKLTLIWEKSLNINSRSIYFKLWRSQKGLCAFCLKGLFVVQFISFTLADPCTTLKVLRLKRYDCSRYFLVHNYCY